VEGEKDGGEKEEIKDKEDESNKKIRRELKRN
jgi:hypothetical protein